MKQFLAIFIAVIFSMSGTAQDSEVDNLLQALKKSRQDTARINILHELQAVYLDADNDSALFYNRQAEALINQLRAEKFRYRCYHAFVKIYHAKFDNAMALEYCIKSLAVAERYNDEFQKANSYRALFSLYFNLRKKDSAIRYGAYALELTNRIKDTNNIATMYGNLCRIYNSMELYNKAVEFGKLGVEAGEQYKDYKGLLVSMNNLGNAYMSLKKNKEAIDIFEKQLVAGGKYKRIRSVLNALINLGIVYYNEGDALNLDRIAKQLKSREPDFDESDRSGASYRYLVYGYNFVLKNKLAAAETAFLQGMQIAEMDSITAPLENLYMGLSMLRYAQQDFAGGQLFDSKWDALLQSEQKKEMAEYAMDLEMKYETENKVARIKLQEVQLKQKSIINYILVGSAIVLLIISLLSYRTYTQKQKFQQQRISELETQQQLAATEAVLKGEEQERTRLAKDLHDGLGGMLSGIKYSFNTMKGNLIMTQENALAFERSMDMLDSSIKEMRRVAHNMMPEALVKFGLDTALKDFCNDINSTGVLRISYLSINVENVVINQTTAITVYRIVQELINNTIKHAGAADAIVQLTKSNDTLSLTVEDDGKGFDKNLLNAAKGIGWSNIQNRVDFLKASLDVKTEIGKGTSVLIELKL